MDNISASIKSRRSGKIAGRPMRQPKTASAKQSPRAKKAAASQTTSIVPPPGQGKRGEQGFLAYLLRQAQAASRLTLERALAELAVTPPQFVVLTMLKAYPGLSGADLARVALLTPQTVGVIIRNLERDGAIRKTPHPVHGRVQQWTLTRRGLTLLEKCRHHALALERRLVAGLDARTLAAIRRWLAKIAADLQDS